MVLHRNCYVVGVKWGNDLRGQNPFLAQIQIWDLFFLLSKNNLPIVTKRIQNTVWEEDSAELRNH